MSRKKFITSGLLVGLTVLSLLLASCQPQTVIVEVEKEKVVTQVVEVEKEVTKIVAGTPVVEKIVETQVVEKVITATPEPKPAEPPVKITWIAVPVSAADIVEVSAAASEYLQSKGINAELEFLPYTYGEWGEKVPLMLTTGEECDLVFTASWGNVNVHNFSAQGAFMPLDNLLPEYAPELWASLTPEQWNAGRAIPGGYPITAVPNLGSWLPNRGMRVLQDILEKYPFPALDDPSQIIPLAEWEPYMKMVLENEPDLWAFIPQGTYGHPGNDYGYDYVPGYGYAVVRSDDPSVTVLSWVDQPELFEYAQMTRRWVEDGLMYPEVIPGEERIAAFAEGKFAGDFGYWSPWENGRPKADHANRITFGAWTAKQYLAPFRTTVQMTAVCATCKHPEVAVQIINLANTDRAFYNLISLGIEGKHWNWVDKEKNLVAYPEGVNASNVGFLHRNWMLGNSFNLYYMSEEQADLKVKEAGLKLNDTTLPSALLGFVFNPVKVEAEIAECSAVVAEYYPPLIQGRVEDVEGTLAKLQEVMKACGNDKVIAELQAQVDAWKK